MLIYASIALAVISLACLCASFTLFRDRVTRFVLLSIWFRYTMAAFPEVTYPSIFFGQSLNALGSLFVVAIGITLIPPKAFRLKQVIPVYILCLFIVISGIVNQGYLDIVDPILKWAYYLVISIAALASFQKYGSDRVLATLALVFMLPLGSQAVSIALGQGRLQTEDGSIVYAGSYESEISMSVILLTYLVVICFAGGVIRKFRPLLMFIGFAGLVFANYRTAMLAGIPILASYLAFGTTRHFSGAQKALVSVVIAVAFLIAAVSVTKIFSERFSDLSAVAGRVGLLLSDPIEFDEADKDLFSGRVYIWSGYIYTYLSGTDLQLLLGYGPDGWKSYFRKYAHNTFVSYLFEFGPLCTFTLVAFLLLQLLAAIRVPTGERLMTFAPHLGFVILNLATMPLWQIEGSIFYAIICARTWWGAYSRRRLSGAYDQREAPPSDLAIGRIGVGLRGGAT